MDLSQLKWLKNVKTDQGWAYDKPHEMSIPESKIFRLHWRSKDDKANAQQPVKGELIALVQLARVTHIVELLDDVVYENADKEWSIYRVVQAVWMPPKEVDWWNLLHQKEIFGVEHLPQNGLVHRVPTDGMLQSEFWKNLGGLPGFQQNLSKLLVQIS
ncbi:MAG: hypothetical protein NTX45_21800 [Proteobacteria bacterium]|nr:hypothetical protein [Pseudomonadota bacterium]